MVGPSVHRNLDVLQRMVNVTTQSGYFRGRAAQVWIVIMIQIACAQMTTDGAILPETRLLRFRCTVVTTCPKTMEGYQRSITAGLYRIFIPRFSTAWKKSTTNISVYTERAKKIKFLF